MVVARREGLIILASTNGSTSAGGRKLVGFGASLMVHFIYLPSRLSINYTINSMHIGSLVGGLSSLGKGARGGREGSFYMNVHNNYIRSCIFSPTDCNM